MGIIDNKDQHQKTVGRMWDFTRIERENSEKRARGTTKRPAYPYRASSKKKKRKMFTIREIGDKGFLLFELSKRKRAGYFCGFITKYEQQQQKVRLSGWHIEAKLIVWTRRVK
jgi:hypothetical protein